MYKVYDKFVLRSPQFPCNFLSIIFEKYNQDKIKSLWEIDMVKDAIWFASESLYVAMEKWHDDQENKKSEKIRESFLQYLIRMSTRCTPFGIFAGLSVGEIDNITEIEIDESFSNQVHCQLDMNYIFEIVIKLSKEPTIKSKLKFYPNNSIYSIGHDIRYIEYAFKNNKRVFNISAVESSEFLQLVLESSQNGATISELYQLLTSDEISLNEAESYIDQLIESQILLSELEPSIVGNEPLSQVINVLNKAKGDELLPQLRTLNKINVTLKKIRNQSDLPKLRALFNVKEHLRFLKVESNNSDLFQLDLFKKTKVCNINSNILANLNDALNILSKLNNSYSYSNLKKFKDAFRNRYEDQEISVLSVLDTEAGLGYPINSNKTFSPLLDGIVLPKKNYDYRSIEWDNVQTILLQKYFEAIKNNKTEVELNLEDFQDLVSEKKHYPETISVFGSIYKNGYNDNTEMFLIKSAGGSNGANLISRFGHGNKKILDLVKSIVKDDEQDKNVIYAEISHLPETRTGNVLLRPRIRDYEIPYLSKSGLESGNIIQPSDLFISLKGNNLILRSKKHNKIIMPRNTTAHNFSYNSLPLYHFLCDLQYQNRNGGFYFSWGAIESQLPFYPRVVYKNITLSLAEWTIYYKDIEKTILIRDENVKLKRIKDFLSNKNIPVEVLLVEGDNELYLNLNEPICLNILVKKIKKSFRITLKEFVFSAKNQIVRGVDGSYANEILFFLKKKNL